MDHLDEEIRKEAEDNNMLWLRSFGCEIVCEKNSIKIFHREMPDYCAVLVTGSPENSMRLLETAIDENSTRPLAYNIYLDNVSSSSEHVSVLNKSGYRPIMINQTLAQIASRETGAVDIEIAPVTGNYLKKWSCLYSKSFKRTGEDAIVDLRRWKTAFMKSDHVSFWFLKMEEKIIGIYQTCVGCGIVGVYSFAISSQLRGKGYGRQSWKAIIAKIVREGNTHIYYDRLVSWMHRNKHGISRLTPNFHIIREFTGFSCR